MSDRPYVHSRAAGRRAGVLTSCLVLAGMLGIQPPLAARETRPGTEHVLKASFVDADTRIRVPEAVARKNLPPTATFEVDFIDFPADARTAFDHAVDVWSRMIVSEVPIRIRARWLDLGPGVLAVAGTPNRFRNVPEFPRPDTWYVDALADSLVGFDLNPGSPDVILRVNSGLGNWYFGTDGATPAGLFDLATVALHEIGHGLGMNGTMEVDEDGVGSWGLVNEPLVPFAYDVFPADAAGNRLIDTSVFANPSSALGAALEGGGLVFAGPLVSAVNGGPPRLFAPATFLVGSSYSHFDEATFPPGRAGSLMTPFLAMSESVHDPGRHLLCLLADQGWETAVDCVPDACVPSATELCLAGERFRVTLEWMKRNGERGPASVVPVGSDDSGLFYFFNPNNWEMLVKVLDNCGGPSNRFWVFAAGTTTLEFVLTVTDVASGEVRTYRNPPGMAADAITDTDAFATCP